MVTRNQVFAFSGVAAAALGIGAAVVTVDNAKYYPSQQDFKAATATGLNTDTCTTGLTSVATFSANNLSRLKTEFFGGADSLVKPKSFAECVNKVEATLQANRDHKQSDAEKKRDDQRHDIITTIAKHVKAVYGENALQPLAKKPAAPAPAQQLHTLHRT